jgi:hypothetical protein
MNADSCAAAAAGRKRNNTKFCLVCPVAFQMMPRFP